MNNGQRGFVDFGPALEFLLGLVILGLLGCFLVEQWEEITP